MIREFDAMTKFVREGKAGGRGVQAVEETSKDSPSRGQEA